jgi:hypothetical protein
MKRGFQRQGLLDFVLANILYAMHPMGVILMLVKIFLLYHRRKGDIILKTL